MVINAKMTKSTVIYESAEKRYRIAYVIEAACENLVYAFGSGVYIARIASEIGISDSLTGVLSSLVSLGFAFQITSVFLKKGGRVKNSVVTLHLLNEVLFVLMYLLPIFSIPRGAKALLFGALLLLGHAAMNASIPSKTAWMMSFVTPDKRGKFTARKHIVLLISGTAVTYVAGVLFDFFDSRGNVTAAYVAIGVGMLLIAITHTAALVYVKEHAESEDAPRQCGELKSVLSDKRLMRIIFLFVLLSIAQNATIPFLGSYQISELGFSMTLISVIAAVASVCRMLAEAPMGRYADRSSFSSMMRVSVLIYLIAMVAIVFTNTSSGKLLFPIYAILQNIASAGVTSCGINLIYEHSSDKNRTAAMALRGTLSGAIGFLTTLLISPLVDLIQKSGLSLFGVPVYAQQILALISAAIFGVMLIVLIRSGSKASENLGK